MAETINTGQGELEVLPKNADAKTLRRTSSIYFGSHKGKTVAQVLEESPGWFLFAQARIAWIKIDEDVLKEAQERVSGKLLTFKLDEKELEEHVAVLFNVAQGLDSYASNGVRQLHGVGNDVSVHRTLDYYRRLSAYLDSQLKAKKAAEATKALP